MRLHLRNQTQGLPLVHLFGGHRYPGVLIAIDLAEALGEGGPPLILPVLEAGTCLWDTLPR